MEELVSLVADCSPFAREKIASLVMKKGYLRQLLDLFKTCEDLEDREGLHMMYRLVKGLVLLNDANLFDELLRDENVMDVVGALEYEYVGEELARKREDEEAEKAAENGEEAAAAKGGEGEPDGNDAGTEDDGERVRSGGEATVTTRPQPSAGDGGWRWHWRDAGSSDGLIEQIQASRG